MSTTVQANNKFIGYYNRAQRERPRMSMIGIAPQAQRDDYKQDDQDTNQMPWTAEQFAQRHNRSLTPSQASSAAAQANTMLRRGVPEGTAIATANARVKRMQRRGLLSPRAIQKHFGRFTGGKFGKFVDKNGDKYGGKDQQPIDANSR